MGNAWATGSVEQAVSGIKSSLWPASNRGRMFGLVQADSAATGQRQLRQDSPAFLFYTAELHVVALQRLHGGLQVVAHEIQFVPVVFFIGMERRLGGWQRKNQPTVSGIDWGKLEDVAEELAVGFGVFAVDDDVSAGDRCGCPRDLNGKHSIRSATATQSQSPSENSLS